MSSPSSPPPPNPILSAYESFVSDTPLITRYALTTFAASFVLCSFIPLPVAIINIPYFTIFRLEIYRLFLSNLICSSLLNLIFGFISFLDQGKRLEFSMGSTNFLAFLLAVGVGANISFTLLTFILYVMSGYQPYMMHQSGGLWLMIFGIIAMECSLAPEGSKRRLFFIEVPSLYYPLALLGLFTLFQGAGGGVGGVVLLNRVPDLISISIGYGFGFGKLNFLKMSVERRRKLEAGVLHSLTGKVGWVVGPARADWVMIAPTSGNSWINPANSANAGGSRSSDEEQGRGGIFQPRISTISSSTARVGSTNAVSSGSGQTLGGSTSGNATRRSNATTNSPSSMSEQQKGREALLAAAERRAQDKKKESGVE